MGEGETELESVQSNHKERLAKIYYDVSHPDSFGSIARLAKHVHSPKAKAIATQWLRSQPTYTIHRLRRTHYPTNAYRALGPDRTWECDLVMMHNISEFNRPFTCLLTVIDIFDKYAWVEPLRGKTARETARGFAAVLERAAPRRPRLVQSDSGGEFRGKEFQSLLRREGIAFRETLGAVKAAVVERFNRTLRDRLWRAFYFRGSYKYTDALLQQVVSAYNRSVHSETGVAPAAVRERDIYGIWMKKYLQSTAQIRAPSYKTGQFVRLLINSSNKAFARGYTQSFTEEIFQIARVQTKHRTGLLARPIYHLLDLSGGPILGGFYHEELSPVTDFDPKSFSYKIERVISKRRGGQELFVKFLGYPESMNRWISASDLK